MDNTDYDKQKDKEVEEVEEVISHYKLTLTHRKHQGLEIAVRDIIRKVDALKAEGAKVKASGPSRLPIKRLHLTTRKSPCGNGTNSYDHWEMKIHKRVFHLHCSQKNFQSITAGLYTEAGMILDAEEIEESEE
jgi:small subunit ribosomal protein S20e